MASAREFLIVDDHSENRFLLAKSLSRKFPGALLQECQDVAPAVAAARSSSLSAAVVHRAKDADGLTLIEMLRAANPTLPILYVSGRPDRDRALERGASRFLDYDAWLRTGTMVDEMLRAAERTQPVERGSPDAAESQST